MKTIYTYTTDQAIDDGVLVHAYPDKYPYFLITATVHGMVEEVCRLDGREYDQVLVPLMMDAVMLARQEMDKLPGRQRSLLKLEHTAVGEVWVQPNDKGGLTIMKPEDY